MDTCLYTQFFIGKGEEAESWCPLCCTADHSRKRSFQTAPRQGQGDPGPSPPGLNARAQNIEIPVRHKYNRFHGDCRRGTNCPYRHVCSCGGRGTPPSAASLRCSELGPKAQRLPKVKDGSHLVPRVGHYLLCVLACTWCSICYHASARDHDMGI